MSSRRKTDLIGNGELKQHEDRRPQQLQEQNPDIQCRRSARLIRRYQTSKQGAFSRVTPQNPAPTTRRKRVVEIEELSQRSPNRAAKRQRANLSPGHIDGQQGNSGFLGGQNFDLKASSRGSSIGSKRSLQHERLSDDPVPPLKRHRTEKNPYVEYWVAHKYQLSEEPTTTNQMEYWFSRPKPLRRVKSNVSLYTQSESGSNKSKNGYNDKNFEIFLQSKGSFMGKHKDGISGDSKELCQRLLEKEHIVPRDTVFEQVAFESTCERVGRQSEMGVIRIIGELIVPSAERAIDLGHAAFEHLISKVNEVWDNSISLDAVQPPLQYPLQPPPPPQASKSSQFQLSRPQPDFAVGFCRLAFNEDQLRRLAPFVGDIGQSSFFMSTADTYFPFLTSEVKCRKVALDVADRQNAHSMTLAVRGVVELFRIVKRLKEVHQEILGFSISHDHCSVRIYGHYPIIDGEKASYYRHTIHKFDFTSLDGRERWTSYNFTMNIYNYWVPSHFKRLCSAIDDIPEVTFDVSQKSGASEPSEELQQPEVSELNLSEATGLSQGLGDVGLGSSFISPGENDEVLDPKKAANVPESDIHHVKPVQTKNKRKRIISGSK